MEGRSQTFFILALVLFVLAVLRWFMKGWAASMGLPEMAGSSLTSLTIFLLIGLVIIFAREGRAAKGRYWRGAGWWVALAAWQQILVIAGILLAARTGASTYYSEMMGAHREVPPVQHAVSHAAAFVFVAVIGLLLGWPVYAITKRGRRQVVAAAEGH